MTDVEQLAEKVRKGFPSGANGLGCSCRNCSNAKEALNVLVARLSAAEQERDERMTRDSGLALIADANRWEKAYSKARDDLAAAEARAEAAKRLLKEWLNGGLYGLSETLHARTEAALDWSRGDNMSAECNECGRDIEYPPGSWPLGECSYCRVHVRLEEAEALLKRFAAADYEGVYGVAGPVRDYFAAGAVPLPPGGDE